MSEMGFEGSTSRFYTYLSLMKEKTNNYLNEEVLKRQESDRISKENPRISHNYYSTVLCD